MKKYLILACISLTLIFSVIATGYSRVNSIEYVSAISVEKETAAEYLIYSGTVEYSNSSACTADGTGVVQSVLVNNGDYVNEGDPILIVYQSESEISSSDILSAITSNDYDTLSSVFENDSSIKTYNAEKSGIISIGLEESSVFQSGQNLFKISPENSFQIQINVTEKDISSIEVGQSVKIECKAIPEQLNGTVKSISKSASQTTTTTGKETAVKTIITVDDDCDDIRVGYTATCSIIISQDENVLLVPYSSVGTDDNSEDFVYLINDGEVQKHYVICGKEYNNGVEITDGLNEKDIIVYDVSEIKNPKNTVVNEVRYYEQ